MLYTDKQVMEMTGLGKDAVQKIRALLRQRGLLVNYQQIDDGLLAVIRLAQEYQLGQHSSWDTAVTQALYKWRAGQGLHDRVFAETSGSVANDLFRQACRERFGTDANYASNYFTNSAAAFDFISELGYGETAKTLRSLEEEVIKSVAFEYAFAHGMIGEELPF